GTGRLHTGPGDPGNPLRGSRYNNPFTISDYWLVNYTFFPNDPQFNNLTFLRDPERVSPKGPGVPDPWRTDPANLAGRGPYVGGFNAPYTYPDLNNLFLAAVKADGTVLMPSF